MSDFTKAVFLSYASQDAEAAKRICEALRAAGIEVWFDQSELVGGDAWDQKIRKQIRECALLIPVISKATQGRREAYFRLEWKLADERTHLMAKGTPFLLPVTIDETNDREALVPDSFLAVQWTKAPAGETPPAFTARVKKILGGGVAGVADPGRARRDEAPRSPTPATVAPRWLRSLLASAVIVIAVLGVTLWVKQHGPAARSPGDPAPATQTPAAELREKVKALIAKPNGVREDLDTAASLMEQVVRLEPTVAATWVQMVWLDIAFIDFVGDHTPSRMKAVRDHLAQATGLAPADYEVRLVQAVVVMHLDNWNPAMAAEAEPQMRSLLRERPDDGRVLIQLSWCLHNLGRHEEQLQLLERAARLPGVAPLANFNRMWSLFYLRRFDEAELTYAGMPPASRSHDTSVTAAAILCFWHGDLEAARRILDGLPPSALVDDNAGTMAFWVHFWRRDYDQALAATRRLAHDFIGGSFFVGPKAYLTGLALAHAGRTGAAQAEWRSALQVVEQRLLVSPNEHSLLEFKVRLLASLGERAEAERLWRTINELYPHDQSGWRALTALSMGAPDQAMDFLAEQMKDPGWVWNAAFLRLEPELDPLRSLPRFQAMRAAAEADPNLSPTARAAAKKPATP